MNIFGIKGFIQKHIITIGIVITLLVAVVLRFKGLTFQSHWVDELFSATISNPEKSFSSMYNATVEDVHPPLYQTILWGWYHLFGFNEYAGRALSAAIGTISIYAIYLLGKEFFNKEVGLYAAIIATMNHFLIFYSQEVRSYSLLFLLSTMSYVYLMKVLTDYSKKNFILYLLFTIALVYTHYFGFFLVATQVFVFIYYFTKEKQQRKHLIILAFITAVTIIVALLPLMDNILSHEGKKSFWIKPPSEWFAIDYMKAYTRSQYLDGMFVLFSIMSLFYLFAKKEQNLYKSATIVLIIWIIIGYALPYIRSVTAIPLLTSRNTIMIIPALILLIAYGIYLIKENVLKITTLILIVFFSLYQLNTSYYYNKVAKQQWREVLLDANKTNKNIPIFEIFFDPIVKDTYGYKTYSLLLDLGIQILDSKDLNKQYNHKNLPNCFFILDSHGDHISKSKLLQNNDIKKVLEIKKHRAKGILYSYNMKPSKCSELYNGILETIDFSKCNMSKPYKGNPLGMLWSGSVTTPVYELTPSSYNLVVNAKGTKAFYEYAKLRLEAFSVNNNKTILLSEKIITTQPKYGEYALPFDLGADNNISFVISFINDKGRKKPKEDRNVYLKSIVIKKQ